MAAKFNFHSVEWCP